MIVYYVLEMLIKRFFMRKGIKKLLIDFVNVLLFNRLEIYGRRTFLLLTQYKWRCFTV